MKSKDKLLLALEKAHAPEYMIKKTKAGDYDDYESESPTPIMDLVRDLKKNGLNDLAHLAMNGQFDASKEEAAAWFKGNDS